MNCLNCGRFMQKTGDDCYECTHCGIDNDEPQQGVIITHPSGGLF